MATELHFRGEGGLYRVVDEADGLPVRLPDDTVKVAPDLITSVVSRAVAAAGNYDANDVVSNSATEASATPWIFDGMSPGVGKAGCIFAASIVWARDDVSGSRFRLFLLNEQPAADTVLADNAALSFGAADLDKVVCYIDFPAMIDIGAFSMAQAVGVNYGYYTTDKLYGVLQILDAETSETAGMTVTIKLHAFGR